MYHTSTINLLICIIRRYKRLSYVRMSILSLLEGRTDYKYLHIRLDTDKDFDYHKTVWDQFPKYIIGHEIAPKTKKEHYHICLGVDDKTFDNFTKQKHSTRNYELSLYIKEHYSVTGSQYSTSIARDSRTLCKYVLKEGDFIYKGFEDTLIAQFSKSSYKKDKKQLQQEFNELDESFLNSEMSTLKYFIKFMKIKTSYGQSINKNYMMEHLRILHFKRDEQALREYASRIDDIYHDRHY